MKRRAETEFSINQKKQKKRAEDLGLNLSSTSDDEPPFSNHATQESSSSGSGSDSESEEKRPVFGSDSNEFKADSLVEGTSSRYSMYNSVSQKLMAKMGFREGEGLGKYSQGRKDIVETSNQKGRRGLGLTLKGFDGDLNIDWRDEPEEAAAQGEDRNNHQKTITSTLKNRTPAERLCGDLCSMGASIPLSKTYHPLRRKFLDNKVWNGGATLGRTQLTETCLLEVFLKEK